MSIKNSKKKNKKMTNRNIEEDLEYYESNNNFTKSYYENYQYLSYKDKMIFDNKFSKPKNKSQEIYVKELNKNKNKIIIATGPAGTGKTLLGTEHAIRQFLLGNCEKLIFTRPSVSVDEDLGFLPGSMEDKMSPFIRPIYDILYNFITPKEVAELIEEKYIEIAPLGFMRGRTFKDAFIVADEMQNSTVNQMKSLLTRLGENTKIIITGDLQQTDRMYENNGLDDFLNKFKGKRSTSITSVEFDIEDIERSVVVKEVLDIYGADDIPPIYSINNSDNSSKSSEEIIPDEKCFG
jgi:phosphate starvation-inducible PhoH-like protein